MKFALALLTHGDAAPLASTLDSFRRNVKPEPVATILCYDGTTIYGHGSPAIPKLPGADATIITTGRPSGFCESTRKLWKVAANLPDVDYDYVFWLEHDFEFLRPVNLAALGLVLAVDPHLAQMALMRDAVNPVEQAAGGLYESRPGEYDPRKLGGGYEKLAPDGSDVRWLEHRSYFTTNPSLMRRSFMVTCPWPDYESECEGRFGADLRSFGYHFGVWGSGEPWVAHSGARNGFGY